MSGKPILVCATASVVAALIMTPWLQETATPATPKEARAQANEAKPNDVAGPMQLKLKYAQKVLEGVAIENFDQVAKNAQMLGLLAQDENWQVYQTVEYRQHSAEFQRISDELVKGAKQKNIDAAALSYLQLTMCCVNCHKHTRTLRGGAK